jgi:hypothetical protein
MERHDKQIIKQSGVQLEPTEQSGHHCRPDRHESNYYKYVGPSCFHSIDDIMLTNRVERISTIITIKVDLT